MTGLQTYSTTASENVQANTGINWDEGMSPAAVNNSARQNMADIRTQHNDLIWFQYGSGSKAPAPVYSSGTIFTQASAADLSTIYHVGRRVKAVGTGTGTIYGTISATSYAASTQTVTVVWNSGSLSNEAITVYLSQAPVTGAPIPAAGISGTKTNDSAAAGSPGEYIEAAVASGGSSISSGIAQNVTSISLTAGDWDVSGVVFFTGGATTTVAYLFAAVNSTSATLPSNGTTARTSQFYNSAAVYNVIDPSLPIGASRWSLASTTTIYLVAQTQFAVSTTTVYGEIRARRVR